MNRYDILLGKKTKKTGKKEKDNTYPPFVRRIYLGSRREGKTVALIKEAIDHLRDPVSQIFFCSFDRDRALNVVRDLMESMRKTVWVERYYPNFEKRVSPILFTPSQVMGLPNASVLLMDDIDSFRRVKEGGLFSVLSNINKSSIRRVIATCDKTDFNQELEMSMLRQHGIFSRPEKMLRQHGILSRPEKDKFLFEGVRWELRDLSNNRGDI